MVSLVKLLLLVLLLLLVQLLLLLLLYGGSLLLMQGLNHRGLLGLMNGVGEVKWRNVLVGFLAVVVVIIICVQS